MWLDGLTQEAIGEELGIPQRTVSDWLSGIGKLANSAKPPESRQHFDIWTFQQADGDSSYFGKMPPQVVENLLWLYTEPDDWLVDPFAGGGTSVLVARKMGRRVYASDLAPSMPTLPIRQHDILDGWPPDAPNEANLILLDPPYWKQAAGRYPEHEHQLGDVTLEQFMVWWAEIVATCVAHLAPSGHLAFIISPTEDDGTVVDHALAMWRICEDSGLRTTRRVIVPYQTQQATGQQVEWARENRRLLKLYRDLVVMRRVNVDSD